MPNRAISKEGLANLAEKVTGKKQKTSKPVTQQTFYTNWKPKLHLRSKEEVVAEMKEKEKAKQQTAACPSSSSAARPKQRAPVIASSGATFVPAKKDDPNFT